MLTVNVNSATVSLLSRSIKLSKPMRRPDLLQRQRLLDFLHDHIHLKLILLSAAAGYGKSSLVAEFAHDTDYPVAWYGFDEVSRDLSTLLIDLVDAFQRSFSHFQSIIPSLVSEPSVGPADLAAALNREISTYLDEYFILVLDDFHLIESSPAVVQFFDALLADLPEQAHLIIIGRSIPPLGITSLAARAQIAGLSEEQLRFTPDEVEALVKLRKQSPITHTDAEELVARTEGWITGIVLSTYLMLQGLMGDILRTQSPHEPLYEYLAEEVLEQQPETLRRFLLESAILPKMDSEVCNEILGISNSAQLLKQAEEQHLFINAVGEEFPTYQYHHLFRDFLLTRLGEEDSQRLKSLQTRAAEWYEANQMPEAAITYYALADQLAKAAEVAEINARAMYESGHNVTLRRWAERLDSVAHQAPTLYLNLAKADAKEGKLDDAEIALQTAAAGYKQRAHPSGLLRVEIQHSQIMHQRGDFEQALTLAETAVTQADVLNDVPGLALARRYAGLAQFALGQLATAEESLLQAEQILLELQDQFTLANTLTDLANVLRVRGQTERATRAQQRALEIWRENSSPGPLGMALNNIGYDLHMLGQYEAALETYAEAFEWAQRAGDTLLEARILGGQGDIFADIDNRSLAHDLYHRALDKAEKVDDWSLKTYLYRTMARLDRWASNYAGALGWLSRVKNDSTHHQAQEPLSHLEGMRGIILIEMGNTAEGRQTLERVCILLERSGASTELAQALFFRARAEFSDGDKETVVQTLAHTFAVVDQVGYSQMLISEALPARDMLEEVAQHPDIGARARELLTSAEAAATIRLQSEATPGEVMPTQTASIEAHAFGQSQVLKEGSQLTKKQWGSQRTRELFFFLIDHAPIPRDRVLETFWSKMSVARASANFRQTLYRMRRAIGSEVVILEDQTCQIAPNISLVYDVRRFKTEADAALARSQGDLRRLEALESAIDLYTGEYLADLAVDWALERRRQLSDLFVVLLRTYADELMNMTRFSRARPLLERALEVEPLHDDLHERMLICLAGLGRRDQVVSHYMRYGEILREELGADPPEHMRTLYNQLIE